MLKFPYFEPLKFDHQALIQDATSFTDPYSDHNFLSLTAWNIDKKSLISSHNNNVIIKLPHYSVNDKYILTVSGNNNIQHTIDHVLDEIIPGCEKKLELIPESIAMQLDPSKFYIDEDPDNHDYIYEVNKLLTYSGNKLGAKRNFVNRFQRLYPNASYVIADIKNPAIQKELLNLFEEWSTLKEDKDEANREKKAINNYLKNQAYFSAAICVLLYDVNKLIGFAIVEVVKEKYLLVHFEKANYQQYIGIYPYIMQVLARIASSMSCTYINYEQDLGLPLLRKSKRSYHATKFLKKYTVKKRLKIQHSKA